MRRGRARRLRRRGRTLRRKLYSERLVVKPGQQDYAQEANKVLKKTSSVLPRSSPINR
jgi:hypothetical protein